MSLYFDTVQIFYMKRAGGQCVRIGYGQKRLINVSLAAMATIHVKNIKKTLNITIFYLTFVLRYFAFSARWLSKEEALIAEDVHGQARE